jgi:hypothetical protein
MTRAEGDAMERDVTMDDICMAGAMMTRCIVFGSHRRLVTGN